ncbi:MAG: ELM1/GtrOC1 family putative glycosyltransferase [Hyphomicrobiaceae bacterium]
MPGLRALILSDGRPGHYHLAEGVVAALGRLGPVTTRTVAMKASRRVPPRLLAALMRLGLVGAGTGLSLSTGLSRADLPDADLVVSAGGDTIIANWAAARLLGARNIFCGTLRRLPPEAFGLVVSSYERHRGLPRHLVTLKPNRMDPDELTGRGDRAPLADGRPPSVAGLLVGGDSGLFHYRPDEWQRVLDFAGEMSRLHGTRWIIATSRRTPANVADMAVALAGRPGVVLDLIDYRTAGPGTLPSVFARSDVILASEDSSTMVSEAVTMRLPVIGVSPADHAFKPEEAEYRRLMQREGWCRFLPIAELSPQSFLSALAAIEPLRENHLDRLARALDERLPGLWTKEETR